ncbi:MAG: lytic transglycosylase domain-containing protein [Alphaproteobacteria bacterium]|nr:lytic transglycosylase domain-containing protein [Alphaproteobacteria bacterium]
MRLRHYLKFVLSLVLLSSSHFALANISQTDLKLTKQVIDTLKQEKYDQAKYLIGEMQNKAAKQVGLHALFRSKGYVTHPKEIMDFIAEYPDWKNLTSIKSIMENRIFRGQYDRASGNNWFNSYPAKTGAGKLFLAEQLFLAGKTDQGLKLLRSVWRGYVLNSKTESSVLTKMGQYFDPWDHKLRADFLMNANMTSAAIRNAGYASNTYTKFYEAREALEKKQEGALKIYNQVADSLKKDMGLKYSLVKYYRQMRDELNGLKVLESMAGEEQTVTRQHLYWTEKFFVIHMLLDRRHNKSIKQRAYKLLAGHKQSIKSVRYTDAEFKAGWVAYVHFGNYKLAKTHFDKSQKNSFSSEDRSRIYYWQAQTARKLGDMASYQANLVKATKYKYTFYGQLAGERIGQNSINIPTPPRANNGYLETIKQNVHADFIQIYNYLGHKKQLKYHYYKLRAPIKNASHMVSLVEFAQSQNNSHYAMDTARKAMIKGWDLQSFAYPNVKFPQYTIYTGEIDKALSYGLIRQESLFDQYAISGSGARGFMQIMPATGEYLAKKYRTPYKLSWLHSKPELNLGLGNSYLYDLIDNFGGSYVMGTAAYNAGGTWVKRWLKANGDPRIGEVAFVNWIEAIPKSETRNYVKKVIKNMQVFKSRFNNNQSRTNIIGALITGEK